jgi:hypothetical protein
MNIIIQHICNISFFVEFSFHLLHTLHSVSPSFSFSLYILCDTVIKKEITQNYYLNHLDRQVTRKKRKSTDH